jgi:hypothetical protein
MQAFEMVVIMAAMAAGFVVTQHGLSNVLIAAGMALVRAGKRRAARVAVRSAEVREAMVRELEA